MMYEMTNPGDAKKIATWRHLRLTGAALGAAIIGLMFAPPQATAGASITTTSDQQIEYALAAATTAQAAYDVFVAAANHGCLSAASNVESCDVAITEPLSAVDSGRETAVPSPSEAED